MIDLLPGLTGTGKRRNELLTLRRFALAALASAAMLAVAGSASAGTASAATWPTFNSSAPSPSLSTKSEPVVFTFKGTSIKCYETMTGETAYNGAQMLLHPVVECPEAPFGWGSFKVNTQGCKHTFGSFSSKMPLGECTAGGMTITWSMSNPPLNCVASVPNQEGQTGDIAGNYINGPKNAYIEINPEKKVYQANVVTSTGLCPWKSGESGPLQLSGRFKIYANSGAHEFWWGITG